MIESSAGWPLVAALLAGLALGASAFAHLVVLSTALLRLPQPAADQLRRDLLPVCYRVCGGLNLLAALLVYQRVEALWLGLVAALFVALDFVLRPQIDFLREAWRKGDANLELPMRQTQRRTTGITLLQTVIGLVLFFRLVECG
jgi:hypothetical protein